MFSLQALCPYAPRMALPVSDSDHDAALARRIMGCAPGRDAAAEAEICRRLGPRIRLYGLTKAANAQLARNLAVEWGPSGVRVNSISPGVIETGFARAITEGPGREARLAKTPMRRFGRPHHVAGTVLWLASEAGAFTTGQNIVVDGGTIISD